LPVLSNTRHELFAQERAKGASVDQAYELAGYKPNRGNAARLNANESVQARVAEVQAAGAEEAKVSVAGVLMELWRIATADPAELVEHHVGCCRYCHGAGHRYQETPRQREARLAQFEGHRLAAAGTPLEAKFEVFDELGGVGFNATRPPAADCPECFGRGEGLTVFKDTRKLSPGAKALYAGVKTTKDGVEVRMHDKSGALTKVGQHLGMFVERKISTDVSLEEFLAQLDEAEPGDAPPAEE